MLLFVQLYNLQLNEQDVIATLKKISESYHANAPVSFQMQLVYMTDVGGKEVDSLKLETKISKNSRIIELPGIKLINEKGLSLEVNEDDRIMVLEKNDNILPDQEIYNKLINYLKNKVFVGQIINISDKYNKLIITDDSKEFILLEIKYDKNTYLPYEVFQQDLLIANDFEPYIQSLRISYSNYKLLKVEDWQASWLMHHFIKKNNGSYQPTENFKNYTLNLIN